MRPKNVFGAFYINYEDELYRNVALRVIESLKLKHHMTKNPVPLEVATDAFHVHVTPYESLIFRSRPTAWGKVVYQYYLSEPYRNLNQLTAGNPVLSRLAAITFLETVYRFASPNTVMKMGRSERERTAYQQFASALSEELSKIEKQKESAPQTQAPEPQRRERGDERHEESEGEEQVSSNFLALMNALNRPEGTRFMHLVVGACAKTAEQLATFCQLMASIDSDLVWGMPGSGWTHDVAPYLDFLQNPDEVRKVIANQIVVQFVNVYRAVVKNVDFFSFRRRGSTSILGLPASIRKMSSISEIVHLVPVEHAYSDDLMAYRIASRTAMVYDRVLPSERVTIYLDKSGSMEDPMTVTGVPGIKSAPKISVACGIALALLKNARKTGHSISLRFFDVEVHPQVRHPLEIIRMLMTVRAGSGTNITNVLEDALAQRDMRNVVITDGIDEVDEEVAERTGREREVEFIFIQTRNSLIERYFRTHRLSTFDATQVMKIVLRAGR